MSYCALLILVFVAGFVITDLVTRRTRKRKTVVVSHRVRSAARKVLHCKGSSKAAKTARGSALTQRVKR